MTIVKIYGKFQTTDLQIYSPQKPPRKLSFNLPPKTIYYPEKLHPFSLFPTFCSLILFSKELWFSIFCSVRELKYLNKAYNGIKLILCSTHDEKKVVGLEREVKLLSTPKCCSAYLIWEWEMKGVQMLRFPFRTHCMEDK